MRFQRSMGIVLVTVLGLSGLRFAELGQDGPEATLVNPLEWPLPEDHTHVEDILYRPLGDNDRGVTSSVSTITSDMADVLVATEVASVERG